jgi:hypothetical protein
MPKGGLQDQVRGNREVARMKFFALDLVLTLIAATETRVRAHVLEPSQKCCGESDYYSFFGNISGVYELLLSCLPIQIIIDSFAFTKNELAMSFASWFDDDLVWRQSLCLGRDIQCVDCFILRLVETPNRRTGS